MRTIALLVVLGVSGCSLCIPEGSEPGTCTGSVVCDRIPPSCPTGPTPGITGGCYSGACIPLDLCPAP